LELPNLLNLNLSGVHTLPKTMIYMVFSQLFQKSVRITAGLGLGLLTV